MSSTPDHFATLGQPRRPWLAPEELKETFHRATATTHPDVTGEHGASAELNAAFATLRDPSARLKHLLELEHPEILGRNSNVPAALAETFLRLATLRRAVDAFIEQQSAAASPLAQALHASERFTLQHDVEKEQRLLEASLARCLEQLQALDAAWAARTPETIQLAAALQQELAYLAKWSWQLRECLFQLTA
jgi:curved DNA-binding protein CbpA